MRQAGRYLPEYREVRARAGSFLDLCYSPELASEVTLQPIRRFDLDAAILFADILIVPHALGQELRFSEGEGPLLEPITTLADLDRLDSSAVDMRFRLIFETVAQVRSALSPEKALIGFCGAPWTVATYMVAGRGSPDQAAARRLAYRDPAFMRALIDLLCETSITYLSGQIAAGADVVQVFDSWAGTLADDQFFEWVIAPTRRIVQELKRRHPQVPIIGFPRGAGALAGRYIEETGVDGISCDTAHPLADMRDRLAPLATVQGNLDPLLLAEGGPRLGERVDEILGALAGKPHVFNLGHGIVPDTPPEHVDELVRLVRQSRC